MLKVAPTLKIILLSSLLLLSGCSPKSIPAASSDPAVKTESEATLPQLLEGEHLLVVLDQAGRLLLLNPDSSQSSSLATIPQDYLPTTQDLYNFSLSPNRHYAVWYNPIHGIIKLDLSSRAFESIRQPSPWLNQNPHLVLHPSREEVFFIDDQGQELVTVNLETNTPSSSSIPFPFGNQFYLAPNGSSIVYVSGFGQTNDFPEYLLTSTTGTDPYRFTTQAPINKRHNVAWTPDSSSIIMLGGPSEVILVPVATPSEPQTLYQFPNDFSIEEFSLVESFLYVYTSDRRWQVIDLASQSIIARAPVEIAQELHRPKFYPWYGHTFLIEETIRLEPEQFSRLWRSNFMGVKTQVLGKFHQIQIQADTPTL